MNDMSLTKEEAIRRALLQTPEMKKHVSEAEIAEYDNLADFLYFSKNPYVRALNILITGTTEEKNEKLIYSELLTNLRSLED